MQVEQFLENSARLYPEKVALIHGRQRLTYGQIDIEANRLAHALMDAGVKRGDRVVIFAPNSVEVVLSIFATLKAGAVFVVLNATTKPDKPGYCDDRKGRKTPRRCGHLGGYTRSALGVAH